jgi:hypothetical protein
MMHRPLANRSALAASTGRPPCAPMRRPTCGEISPAISRPSDTPPTMKLSGQPVSAAIGAASTPGK